MDGTSNSSRRRRLVEIVPSDSRLKRVLSYKTYSLQNKDQRASSNVCKKVGTWTKRMAVAIPKKYDGTDPVSLLQFLSSFKAAADINGISEGAARLILPNFVTGKASTTFTASVHADAVHEDSGAIKTYGDAISWLLRTYAKDRYIQNAINKIQQSRQKIGETEMEFGERLILPYSRFAGVYPS